ncbi:MAG TPA: hypothetical protein VMU35_00665 [Methylomirabilota bacterium]|nr:hypothetical protein [Methylomirabilota bacterium]
MVARKTSEILSEKEELVTVGGVHDELRHTEPHNMFFKKAQGSKIWDMEGKTYTD